MTSTCDVRLSWSVRTERCFARRGFSASSLIVSRASTPRADHAAEARVLRRVRSGAVASSGATPPPLAALIRLPDRRFLSARAFAWGSIRPRARSAARASIAPVAPVSTPCPPVTAASTARSSSLVSSKARRCESPSRGASSRGALRALTSAPLHSRPPRRSSRVVALRRPGPPGPPGNVLSPQPRARLDVAIIVLEPACGSPGRTPRRSLKHRRRSPAPHFAPDGLRAQKRHVRADVTLARGEDDLDLRACIVRANAADGR